MRWLTRGGPKSAVGVAWLVVGLGNPGPRYAGTRHNLGRDVVETLAARHGILLGRTRFQARFGRGDIAAQSVVLAEPLTFMNLSGQAVAALARFYRLPPERVLLLYDELDLPLGVLRLRPGGGSAGHQGVASVLASLGTLAVPRLRLGIGRPPAGWDAADYVLARFNAEERDLVGALLQRAADAVEMVLSRGLEAAMNAVNR